jgi:ABC-type antimicrobial peptide transport system permease subunit
MGVLLHSLREAIASLRREKKRLLPMALGIVWGMASVMVLLAVATGFESSQRQALEAYGDRFILLRLNRRELDRAAGGEERRFQMDGHDLERLRDGAPAISRMSPMNMAFRARMTGRSGSGSNLMIAGVLPEISRLRNLPLAEGRFFNDIDDRDRRRVMVLGPVARKQLFGDGPAVGMTVRVAGFSTAMVAQREPPRPRYEATLRGAVPSFAGSSSSSGGSRSSSGGSSSGSSRSSSGSSSRSSSISSSSSRSSGGSSSSFSPSTRAIRTDRGKAGEIFEIIGVLADVETTRESYVSTARVAFVPFATSMQVFDRDYSTILIEPRSVEDRDLALRQFREVMGARYGFDPDDRNAVLIYFDSIERARSIKAIFGGVRFFLVVIGVLILAVGAIGVMNVILVSVAARTFEIGLRKALGATPFTIYTQFFLEAVLACLLSGLFGFVLGAIGIELLSGIPLPEGFSSPVLDLRTAGLSFGILAVIAIPAGVYPARRAALLVPVEALRAK